MELLAIITAFVGSLVLAGAFIPQAKLIYTLKHTYGISKASWVQNYIGRLSFAFYYAFTPLSLTVLPTVICNIVIATLSVPMVYYAFRNGKTGGEYKKENFSKKLFSLRMLLDVFLIVFSLIVLLMTASIDVIKIPHDNKIFNLILGIVATGILSSAFLPQTFKTIRTRKTHSISLMLTVLFSFGNIVTTISFVARVLAANQTLDKVQYVGPIVWVSISTIAMLIIVVIKIINIKKGKDKK